MNLAPLKKILPESLIEISIGSQTPTDIMCLLDTNNIIADTVVLSNGDVWRYHQYREQIFNHPKLFDKKVFLQTMGYSNQYYGNNKWEVSYPGWYWLRTRSSSPFVVKGVDLNYGFSCLNNRASIDRLILGYKFYTNDLLNKIIFSQNLIDSENAINRVTSDFQFDGFEQYKNLLPIRAKNEADATATADFRRFKGFPGYVNVPHPAFDDAYCNIYVESECEEYPYSRNINLPVMTEKSHKPFIARQIPIALAARGHLAYLKGLGFEMFEDLFPAGYDNMPVLNKIDHVINLVKQGKEFIQDYYFDHVAEIKHNYELVNSDKVETLILQRISSLINT